MKSPYIEVEKVPPLFSQISKYASDQRSQGRALFPALALKMPTRNCLPRCTALFNQIAIEMFCYLSSMHLGKNSLPPSLAQSFIVLDM